MGLEAGGDSVGVTLRRSSFGEKEREAARFGALAASLFRYDSGVEAVRLTSPRGEVVVLPYLGQMVWSARFDGVDLAMESMFPTPRPAKVIVETYGCLAYHSGLLRSGVPSAADDHPLHGEMPCAPMDEAGLECGVDARGPYIAATGARDYAMGFGSRYRATPRVVLRAGETGCDIVMTVENRSSRSMDLMYMCHVNFAFAAGARIVQPAPFTPAHVVARTVIPSFVTPTDDYRTLLAELAVDPGRMRVLDQPQRYDPEQVAYVRGAKPAADGLVHYLMLRREGDAFAIAWDPEAMPHTIRWILVNGDQKVAAFAMPGTCEPEGYAAEKRKGHVRQLAGGERATFATRIDYIDKKRAAAAAQAIEGDLS